MINKNKKSSYPIYSIYLFLGILIVHFTLIAALSPFTFAEVVLEFVSSLVPLTHFWSSASGVFFKININIYLMAVFFLALLFYFIRKIFRRETLLWDTEELKLFSFSILAFTVLLYSTVLIKYHYMKFGETKDMSIEEKEVFMNSPHILIAKSFRESYPGKRNCEYKSDFDLNGFDGMTNHRKLAYYLLPEISIRGVYAGGSNSCQVICPMKDAEKSLPEGFRVQNYYDENCILAVKK
ncbi:MAG: hypothetical protein HQL27_07065 [Candidatus Omnitrophica bacterium]|nr:hypothetical protein [Candidatus Omnitrophota bacterium]